MKPPSRVTRTWTNPATTATTTRGVIREMIAETFSTSSMPVTSTSRVIRVEPAHVGQPNCWASVEPAPASMTTPIAKSVTVTTTSRMRAITGCETLRKTTLWSAARNTLPSWRMTAPPAVTSRPASPAPTMPIQPKPTKYWMTSAPVAKPAPTSRPTKARAIFRDLRATGCCTHGPFVGDGVRPSGPRDRGRAGVR
ncbi:Uncharacterised protein [Streptococcus pneumoniae]|nr:Uncharacterised protein [Streptococcus pneumoniae]